MPSPASRESRPPDRTGRPARARPPAPVGRLASQVSSGELVGRILEGDRWAEEALYRRFARPLANIAARLLGDPEEALDVVQDTFIVGLEQLSTLREPSMVEAWLKRIAIRLVHRRLRRRRLRRRLGFTRADVDRNHVASPDVDAEMLAELRRIRGALEAASSDAQIVWTLRVIEGYTVSEVAAAMEMSASTVKRRMREAQQRVEAHVKNHRGPR